MKVLLSVDAAARAGRFDLCAHPERVKTGETDVA